MTPPSDADAEPTALYRFRGRASGEYVYRQGPRLIAEWNNHGEGAHYEFADVLVLDRAGQESLEAALNLAQAPGPNAFAAMVAEQFETWFEFYRFLTTHKISFEAPSVRPETRPSAAAKPPG